MQDFIFKAKALINEFNTKNYPDIKEDNVVFGYYVKCRGKHYILQQWNEESGYDERWEASEWVEVRPETVELVK